MKRLQQAFYLWLVTFLGKRREAPDAYLTYSQRLLVESISSDILLQRMTSLYRCLFDMKDQLFQNFHEFCW